MSVAVEPWKSQQQLSLSEHIFAPRFWVGMNLGGWLRLLARNRWDVSWQHWHVAIAVTAWGVFNSFWSYVQALVFNARVDKVQIDQPPIFVLGHWRSGTTLLHELMVLDQRHGFPSTFACLSPNHFLLTEPLFSRWSVLPSQRPMDNMPAGWDRPQEDEFALCNLGMRSPYLTIAFPNHPPQDPEYLTMEGLSDQQLTDWKAGLMRFLKQLYYRAPKRLVLKSPTHTGRVGTLLEMFPEARFVHIVRDPYTVYASTMNLWRKLYPRHGVQVPRFEGLQDYVLDTFAKMYRKFDADVPRIPQGHFCEVRYEDLVNDPLGEIEKIYTQLELGGFAEARPKLEAFVNSMDGYQTNRYPKITDAERQQVAERWGPFMRRCGYDV